MLQIQRGERGFFFKCQYGIWKKMDPFIFSENALTAISGFGASKVRQLIAAQYGDMAL